MTLAVSGMNGATGRQGSMLRICIPIEDRARGGMYTFLRYFREWMDRQGMAHTGAMEDDYDVLFVNSFMVPFEAVRAARDRLPGMKVVQRVDGSAADYGRDVLDDVRQARVNLLSDLTVFQSGYGRLATTRKFRVLPDRGEVISNPVDHRLFEPEGTTMALPGDVKVGFVSYSTNPRKGAPLLYSLAAACPGVSFFLAGEQRDVPALGNVRALGAMPHDGLPPFLRGCHVMAFLAENETCPNVVLEAMACGVPVLYLDSGGTSEIVGEAGLPVTVETFDEQLRRVLHDRPKWSARARKRVVDNFTPDHIFPRYIRAVEGTRRRRSPVRWRILRAILRGYPVLFPKAGARSP